jgi:hypothetical protein
LLFVRHLPKYLVPTHLIGDTFILTVFYLMQQKYYYKNIVMLKIV